MLPHNSMYVKRKEMFIFNEISMIVSAYEISSVACLGLGGEGMLEIGIKSHGFNTKFGRATSMEFGVKIPQGFDVQSARGALREILGGNGKLRRSGGAVITTIVVDNHNIEFES